MAANVTNTETQTNTADKKATLIALKGQIDLLKALNTERKRLDLALDYNGPDMTQAELGETRGKRFVAGENMAIMIDAALAKVKTELQATGTVLAGTEMADVGTTATGDEAAEETA